MNDIPHRTDRQLLVPAGGIDCHARDMSVTIAADVPLGAVQDQLRDHGQWLPIDGDRDAPVGRLVERNSTGPLRLGYGAWRDLLLGCQFTNGRGQLISAGGMTVKNVAGYDLTKFMVGQSGVFGRLNTITTRTWRRPTHSLMVTFAPSPRVLRDLLPTPCRPQWAMLTPDSLRCGFLGDEPAIAYYAENLQQYCPGTCIRRSVDDEIAERAAAWRTPSDPTFVSLRISVPPGQILDAVRRAGLGDWVADAAFGIIIASIRSAGVPQSLFGIVDSLGGRLSAWRGDGSLLASSASPGERELLGRLKAALDPDGVLAPIPAGGQ